jgi:hypothetical protein
LFCRRTPAASGARTSGSWHWAFTFSRVGRQVSEEHTPGACRTAPANLFYPYSNKILREDDNGLDHSDPRRDLHRPRDQRLPAGRVLIATLLRLV